MYTLRLREISWRVISVLLNKKRVILCNIEPHLALLHLNSKRDASINEFYGKVSESSNIFDF